VHLIEVGTSAGLNLRFDRYGYRVGGRQYGDPASPVQLVADLYGTGTLTDLDVLPALASRTGVDLNPVDVRDPDHRRWLEALVWPENHDQRPPAVRTGDAVDVLPDLGKGIPAGEPRVVFHSATRMHVPADRLDAFDAAIAALGDDGPLWWLSLEETPYPDLRPEPRRPGAALELRSPDGGRRTVAVVDGHLRWVETLPASA
jgi:hypothetical protein